MTSMFDQFEQASQKLDSNNDLTDISSGYINMKMEKELPIFTKSKMCFNPSAKITHVAISNKNLAVAMANGMLFRMNIHQPEQQNEISLHKYTALCPLTNLFLDPSGNHLLISFGSKSPELLYLSRKSVKLKVSTKFKGHEITEVAWNNLNESESTTGPILLGTSKGLIFETEIALDGDKFLTSGFSSSIEQYWRQVFDIGKGTDTPITGLHFDRITGTDKYFIFVATPNKLYFFARNINCEEKPLLQQVFNKYLNIPEKDTFYKVESKLRYSRLRFWSENLTVPDSLAWMTEGEILYSKFDLPTQENINSILANAETILFPKPLYQDYSVSQKPPIACVLTEFHVLLAYTDAIKGISLLNRDVVYEDNYNEAFGKLINIIKDPMTGTIWAVTENAVFRFKITKEERNIWQIYCEKQQFDLAKKYSRQNPVHYDQVLKKEADMLFEKKVYEASAQRYAETQTSFEEVCLKFIQVDQKNALKIFLKKKMERLSPQDKTQITLIVIWVVELYLDQLEEMRITGKEQTATYFDLQKEFQAFLALPQVSDCIKNNKSTIYDLMASHGDKTNLIQLTIVNKDFEKLIRQHIYKNNFHEALDVLKSQNNRELFYQFAPILMQEIPKFTVKALIDKGAHLSPVKLLPALVSCDSEEHSREIVKYLEFCVGKLKCSEKAIHNLLLTLFAKYDPQKLMEYLNSQGQDIGMVNYDVHFALRLCTEKKLTAACVQLSGLLGLWETAVDQALTINVELAKQIANMPSQEDEELRKKLWLKIAQHVVSGKDNIEQAMEFIQQCELLKIEDILPFFSDFVTIDHFRDAICKSLKDYNQQIQALKDEMREATQSSELVRKEIQSFRNSFTYVSSSDVCEVCNLTLMIRPFYLFPCRHKFHNDCLLKELNPMLGPIKKNKLADLHRQLNAVGTLSAQSDNISTCSGLSTREAIKADIDSIVASECLYCGENMIRNIDMPFIDESDYEKIMKDWE
ncbi:vacuolar protein sorting-associated protein 18 homolog isoform X2 [Agrilus planipennis]|uniref:Vacuolar protein sorting-associated protein 18 homolog n=1 Tax=Agrilus planipennis TaxID=224129 RepID=A0A1W4WF15_AGRPL|nr:vacuolar protein sorting-associated protein 18 homolog isoform X2 [Agrilus planipennis]